MLGTLQEALTGDVPWLWLSARTFGIGAWLTSSLTILLGLTVSTRLLGRKRPPRTTTVMHRSLATLTLVFVLCHIAALIPDPYAKISLIDTVVPGLAPKNTLATALGSIAFLALILVSVAGIARSHMSAKLWKTIHAVAFVVWPLASIHFIMMGTDAMASWSLVMILAVGSLVVLLILRRGYVVPRGAARRAPLTPGSQPASQVGSGLVAPRIAELEISRVVDETADAKTLVFRFPAELARSFAYRPGQHLTLRVPSIETGSVARCYSLSSAPTVDRDLRVTVKRVPGGYASNWLCDNARPGMRLQVLRPAGTFTPGADMTELLLFAGGSGITPMLSIIKDALDRKRCRITLVYANRDERSIIFRDELAELARRHSGQLVVHHWLQSVSGIPTVSDATEALASHRDADVFVCGPAPYMELVTGAARMFGWPDDRIHIESFRSLEGDPFAPRLARAGGQAATQGGSAVLTRTSVAQVKLDGRAHEVQWPEESSLVDAMLDAGIDAPYSCLEGACATCECKLVRGTVESKEAAHAEGERVLGCQVRPTSEAVEIHF